MTMNEEHELTLSLARSPPDCRCMPRMALQKCLTLDSGEPPNDCGYIPAHSAG
jgi:hypothetical protein